jgi:hypothetical protein
MFPFKFSYIFVKPGHSFLTETQYPVTSNSVRFPFAWINVSFRKLHRQSDLSCSTTLSTEATFDRTISTKLEALLHI